MVFTPINLQQAPGYCRFENESGLPFVAQGVQGRCELLLEAAASIDSIAKRGLNLLKDFMKHAGRFDLESVEMLAAPDDDGASLILRYSFNAASDPHEFTYTYFDVWYKVCDPPLEQFWPIK